MQPQTFEGFDLFPKESRTGTLQITNHLTRCYGPGFANSNPDLCLMKLEVLQEAATESFRKEQSK